MCLSRIDLCQLNRISIATRENKVDVESFARPVAPGGMVGDFIDSLPGILAGNVLREIIDSIVTAKRDGKPVIVTMGAHVIKVGLNPILIDLMRRGAITALGTNGAGSIHDVETALFGVTSEDVSSGIVSGEFGMVKESNDFINEATRKAAETDSGLGESLGRELLEADAPHADKSVLAQGAALGVPVTVHLAIGSDINHMHPTFDPAAAGVATHRDFLRFAECATGLKEGGVLMNVGSAVLLPTIIEKSLAIARNLGHNVSGFAGINLDFVQQYRSTWNPVRRAEELGGRGLTLIGHHEILVPLIAAGVVEGLEEKSREP
ncbi:MAG: hypothetical protein GW893_06840 [Armatimonadetes bacterium]|nr:hypothetical protein [Armatimonadota bacterium]PIU63911.1 MAG: hypothetical protein COS85_14575 [Armatimonadetes bacterium CG07_land_8_20_14_0_80_59_28]PIX44137.1 MAG: hypothetical protein COZ56_05405 [Armatimonadetes bacterium CG_4_8_14_3_um_filter_58_9]